jgi:pSer/pThr/pTyr-binding forkhead associated (FHA) protein
MRTWMIGSAADCDLVVARPTVSGRHCRLTETTGGYLLEDLGSSNGSYVNGERIASVVRISAKDVITLGMTVPMPWPQATASPDTTFVRIGRDADNDIVLDDPRVSGHHARLVMVAGSPTLIEDLGSSNGTFLNSVDLRATQPVPIRETDTVYFGTFAVPASRLLARVNEFERPAVPSTAQRPPAAASEPVGLELAAPSPPPTGADRWWLAVSAQAPILAVLIVLFFGRQARAPVTAASWTSVGQGIASTTFWLASAAIWLGCSLAVAEVAARPSPARQADADSAKLLVSFGSRLGVLVAVCAAACALLLAIVYWGNGLGGPWPAMWGVLVLAATVGLLLGLVVTALVPNWATAAAVLLVCFVPMIALGGFLWPLPGLIPPIRLAAGTMPSRWAFEGLLLLETAQHAQPTDATRNDDLAEGLFPVDSERMGPKADAMALGAMLIGLAAAAVFISSAPRPSPRAP